MTAHPIRLPLISDRTLPAPVWNALAGSAVLAFGGALAARGHFRARVRLSHTAWLSAPSAVAMLSAVAVLAAVIGRRHEVLGLLGLAATSVGTGVLWLLLGDHRFAGPVILYLAREHGVHIGDALALIPFGVGLVLARMAWVARSRPGDPNTQPNKSR